MKLLFDQIIYYWFGTLLLTRGPILRRLLCELGTVQLYIVYRYCKKLIGTRDVILQNICVGIIKKGGNRRRLRRLKICRRHILHNRKNISYKAVHEAIVAHRVNEKCVASYIIVMYISYFRMSHLADLLWPATSAAPPSTAWSSRSR